MVSGISDFFRLTDLHAEDTFDQQWILLVIFYLSKNLSPNMQKNWLLRKRHQSISVSVQPTLLQRIYI